MKTAGVPLPHDTYSLDAPSGILAHITRWLVLLSAVRLVIQIVVMALVAGNSTLTLVDVTQTTAVLLLAVVAALMRRLALSGRPVTAVKLHYLLNMAISLFIGLISPSMLPAALGMPLFSIVLSAPFVRRRVIQLMIGGLLGVGVGALGIGQFSQLPPPQPHNVNLAWLSVALNFTLMLLTLLRFHEWLLQTAREMRETHMSLSIASRTLEAQVSARTAQLERQIDIAREAQSAVTHERDFANAILSAISQGLLIVNAKGGVVYANAALERLLGAPPDALKDRSVYELCAKDDRLQFDPLFAAAPVLAGPSEAVMVRLKRVDGSPVVVSLHPLPLSGARDGNRVIVVTDLTEYLQADAERRLLQSVVEHSDEPIVITDAQIELPGPQVLYVNRAFERLTGYSTAELLGQSLRILQGPDSDKHTLDRMNAALIAGRSITAEALNYRKNGEPYWAEWNITPVRDEHNHVAQWVAMMRETTDRHRAEQLLRQQNDYLEALHDTTLGIVNHLDLQSLLQSIVDQIARLIGTEDSLIVTFDNRRGRTNNSAVRGIWAEHAAFNHKMGEGLVGGIWARGVPLVIDDYDNWDQRRPSMQRGVVVSIAGVPMISEGKTVGALVASRSERGKPFTQAEVQVLSRLAALASVAYDNARLYEQLRAHELDLERRVEQRTRELRQALLDNDLLREQAVQAAAQSERAKLARDLHDSVSQAVYGIALGARTIQESGAAAQAPQIAAPLEYILTLAEAALTEMRALIFELRPEALREEGLRAALEKQAAAIHARHGLTVHTEIADEPHCEYIVKEALYRIALEAMQNSVKHARASTIGVLVSQEDGVVRMELTDNGIGFDPASVRVGGLGRKSMHERALALGGTLSLESAEGSGTRIIVRLPAFPASHATGASMRVDASSS
jgi:PAS domain S-box-containing protein